MDNTKRKALIRTQAAKKKEFGDCGQQPICKKDPCLKETVGLRNLKFL